jgi:hypothetical protein
MPQSPKPHPTEPQPGNMKNISNSIMLDDSRVLNTTNFRSRINNQKKKDFSKTNRLF